MSIMSKTKSATDTEGKLSAREEDKIRRDSEKSRNNTQEKTKIQRKVSNATRNVLPYEQFVSEYITLVERDVPVGKERMNLYSKTYLVPDINYSSAPNEEQKNIMLQYMDLLNGFDSTTTLQVTLVNSEVNKKEFEKTILLQNKDDGCNNLRDEMNTLFRDRLMLGQNGIQCKKYFTVTISAIDFDVAQRRFVNYEAHMSTVLKNVLTEAIPQKSNEKARILANIFRDVNAELHPFSRSEFVRTAEKNLICPDYFEFQKDYFMYNDKYARCIFFRELPKGGNEIHDGIFKELIDTNLSMIISKNIEFVPPNIAEKIVRNQITNMQADINKIIRQSIMANRGVLAGDPTAGKPVSEELRTALELLDDIISNNEKMMLCQFIIMLTGDSLNEVTHSVRAAQAVLQYRSYG